MTLSRTSAIETGSGAKFLCAIMKNTRPSRMLLDSSAIITWGSFRDACPKNWMSALLTKLLHTMEESLDYTNRMQIMGLTVLSDRTAFLQLTLCARHTFFAKPPPK